MPKDAPRVHACGALDEAASHVGMARAAIDDPLLDDMLAFVQHRLFDAGATIADDRPSDPSTIPSLQQDDVRALERFVDVLDERTDSSRDFVLPAGCEASARLHVARTVVRRAERQLVSLARNEPVPGELLAFVNRLSDLLFVAARYSNALSGVRDVPWDPGANAPDIG